MTTQLSLTLLTIIVAVLGTAPAALMWRANQPVAAVALAAFGALGITMWVSILVPLL